MGSTIGRPYVLVVDPIESNMGLSQRIEKWKQTLPAWPYKESTESRKLNSCVLLKSVVKHKITRYGYCKRLLYRFIIILVLAKCGYMSNLS